MMGEDDSDEAADEVEETSEEAGVDTPPHSCPDHPETDVLGACSRCGTYYCSECLEEADRPPDSSRCATCPIEVPEPRAFGGWLVLPAIHLVFNPVELTRRLATGIQELRTSVAEITPLLILEALYTAAFLGLNIVAAYHFFRKKKSAINLMLGVYLAAIALTLLDLAVTYYVVNVLGVEMPMDPNILRGFVGPAIWIAYFTNSKRVRETFVVE